MVSRVVRRPPHASEGTPMPVDSMTPKERWLAVMRREKPDRLPMDYWATPEATANLLRHLGCADECELFARLHIDRLLQINPAYVGPPLREGCDMFGCRRAQVSYGYGTYDECVGHPLAEYDTIAEIQRHYTWPSADWFDYAALPAQVRGKEQYPLRGGGSEPFLTYCELRGLQTAYKDLITRPDLVHYCLGKLFDLAYEHTRRIYEALPGQVLFSYVAEDLGSQESLLFSPKVIRAFFLPGMRRMVELAHQAGVYAFCHSDGAIRPIIPDLLSLGIDLLNPIQWRCRGMDRRGLKRELGPRVVFHGGLDNQQTLAFGSVADVRQEVLDNIEILGAGGGYILAPCHNLQAISPPENIIAMYETGYAGGWT
jgi:uroporphyrinogen decarboxylase